jgi:DNA polymerase
MKDILNLDLETFSTEDIKNGSYKYAEGMIILLLAYSFNYEPVQLIDFTIWQDMEMAPEEIWKELPDRLRDAFLDPNVIKKSANVNFERTQLGKYFNIYIPPEQCQCTLVHAGMAGYPMNLDMCAKALKLEQLKSSVGKALIRIFCIPNKDGSRNYPYQFPEKWLQFGAYCIQDVVVEQEIEKAITWYIITPLEHQIWCMGERKNERGVRIDRELIDSAIYLDNIYRTNLVKEALELTGLSNPNSPKQLKDWLKTELEQDDDIKSLDKNAVSKMLREVDDEKVLRVLTIRKQLAKSSITKYAAMERQASSIDDRIRGMFQYYGAQKSGRESGRLSQPQNYPRIEDWFADLVDDAREIVRKRDFEGLNLLFDNVPHVLSQLLRTAFIPGEGKELAVLDFKAVEAVILAHIADEEWRVEFFRKGGDIYIESASAMFKIPRESVTKDIRQKSKISELLCQYGGTKKAMMKNNDTIEDPKKRIPNKEMKGIVDAWRKANPNIVQLWWDTGKAAVQTVKTHKAHNVTKGISFYMIGKNLQMKLPSGRSISYVDAHVKNYWMGAVRQLAEGELDERGQPVYEIVCVRLGEVKTGERSEFDSMMRAARRKQAEGVEPRQIESLAYWGMDKVWCEIETYGPKLVQNFVEGWGRDLLMHSIIAFEAEDMPAILSVHDEGCFEIDKGSREFDVLKELMIRKPKWAEDMPLNADGFIGDYYKK